MQTFAFAGRTFSYVDNPNTEDNERRVEVALGLAMRAQFGYDPTDLFEVGNVLQHHCKTTPRHPVLDLHEPNILNRPDYFNEDVLTFEPPRWLSTNILSLSTLEHIDQVDEALMRVLNWGDNVLVTMPLGYRNEVDQLIHLYETEIRFLRRVSVDNRWVELTREEFEDVPPVRYRYNSLFNCANMLSVWMKGRPFG